MLQQQLAAIIGTTCEIQNISKEQVDQYQWIVEGGNRYWYDSDLSRYMWIWDEINLEGLHNSHGFQILSLSDKALTEQEIKLINLLLVTMRQQGQSDEHTFLQQSEEMKSREFGAWLQEKLSNRVFTAEIPKQYMWHKQLQGELLPFLLHCEETSVSILTFNKLYKLLKSYFGKEVILIPIERDWLILLGANIIADLQEDNEDGNELGRDMLVALSEGLYEVITSEWGGGGFHLTASDGLVKLNQLLAMISSLRETIELGRLTYVGVHIHFAWQLQLERLVHSISPAEKSTFIEAVGTGVELFKEEETLTTLETFFQLDCNVSETAKRLYIHRNTLLYRLEKFKQESGLDVKSFRDAVLVQLGLLLYKLTKKP